MTHVAIVGGGILGTATLEALSRAKPAWTLTLIEKENRLAVHQSGRNSGVIHSGIYYRPGSLKALYCRTGAELLERFCQRHGIHFERRGKLISASREDQLPHLAALLERGRANDIECRQLTAFEAKSLEPRLLSHGAIEVPGTGIVDYAEVAIALAQLAEESGASVRKGVELTGIRAQAGRLELKTSRGALEVDGYINCAGLHSDRVASMAGLSRQRLIVPFRGEYFRLKPAAARGLSGRLIYPVPDPRFPFLGVHLTSTLQGEFLLGPNAVLALAREGYSWSKIDPGYLIHMLTKRGLLGLASKYWRYGLTEVVRSLSRARFAKTSSQLIEGIRREHLVPAESGVRAQLVSASGQLVDDFQIESSPAGLHLLNAPSPAATASLAIGQELAQQAARVFG